MVNKKRIRKASSVLEKIALGTSAGALIAGAVPVDLGITAVTLGSIAGIAEGTSKILKLFGGSLSVKDLNRVKRINKKMKKHKASGGSFASMAHLKGGGISLGDIKFLTKIIKKHASNLPRKASGALAKGALKALGATPVDFHLTGGGVRTGGAIKKRKRKAGNNKWITALKMWNKGKGHYIVPRKGTAGYNEVKQIMASL